jgi:hypothetical protein
MLPAMPIGEAPEHCVGERSNGIDRDEVTRGWNVSAVLVEIRAVVGRAVSSWAAEFRSGLD